MRNRLHRYLEAIDAGKTEFYWDKQKVYKGRMKKSDFKRKWEVTKIDDE